MIGIFDSGIGGLSVWKEINHLLPNISTIYLGDQAYAPYGDRPAPQIQQRGLAITSYFKSLGVKLIVVACNTATVSITVNHLRQTFPDITFIGVEPPVKPLIAQTKTKKVAIYATTATCHSPRLKQQLNLYAKGFQVFVTPTPEWAPLVETNDLTSNKAKTLISKYVIPHLKQGVDAAGLGCTHYPFLKPVLREIANNQITFIDIGVPVAKRVQFLISEPTSSSPASHLFLTTSTNKSLLSSALVNLLGINSPVKSITV